MPTKITFSQRSRHLVAPELLDALDALPTLDLTPELLQAMKASPQLWDLPPSPLTPSKKAVNRREEMIPGPAGAPPVRVLVYSPASPPPAPMPALLHIHGGGFVIGGPELNDTLNRRHVSELNCVVVSVDYRLAPETAYPGPVEDCYAALAWMHEHAEILGIDRERIAIGGESAGGGLTVLTTALARDRKQYDVCLQLLDSPMLDDRTGSVEPPHTYCGEYIWTLQSNRLAWQSFLGCEPGGSNVPQMAVPARLNDLSEMPPAFIIIGMLDLFLEETLTYARRLMHQGVPIELHVIPGAYHGFPAASEGAPQVRSYYQLRSAALEYAWKQTP